MHRRAVEGVSSPSVARRISGPWRGGCVYQVTGQRLKSIAASGWGPELIPDDEILQSQFPEVLEQIEQETARIAELEGLFAAVSGGDEDEGEAENGVLPKSLVKSLKEEKNNLGGEIKETKKRIKQMRSDADQLGSGREASELRTEASDMEGEALGKFSRIEEICGPSTP